MKRWVWFALTALMMLALMGMIACDSSDSDSGGTATNGGSGATLATLAGKWKVFYTQFGYAGHTITLAADGTIIAQAEEECGPAGGSSGGSFHISAGGYLVSKNAWLKCASYPAGDQMVSVYQLEIRPSGKLKGNRDDTYVAAGGAKTSGGSWSIYLTR